MNSYNRRLPVYLVIDCSESMAGPAIEEVQAGLQAMLSSLLQDPMALETVYISVITFAREARQILPLSELFTLKIPTLGVRTGTSLGAALRLLQDCLNRDVVRSTPTTKGDYRPIVVLLTDGQPTDDWRPAVQSLHDAATVRPANIYAIGCGPDVDYAVLGQISDIVLRLENVEDGFRKLFVWLSASVRTASVRVGTEGGLGTDPLGLIDLPPGILSVPLQDRVHSGDVPRQVFLHALCASVGKPYVMRYAREDNERRYRAVAAHPLAAIEPGDSDLLPPISSGQLRGVPRCPYCLNPNAGLCGCGTLFCTGDTSNGVDCPGCGRHLVSGSSGGEFDISRVQG